MISSNDEEIEHFRGGGGGGGGRGGGRGGGFGGGYGGYGGGGGSSFGGGYGGYGVGGRSSGLGRNANIGYRGDYYGGGDDYGWNNYIPVDTNDYDNTVFLPSEITENFNNEVNNNDKNQVSIIWYLISIILILFIIYRN